MSTEAMSSSKASKASSPTPSIPPNPSHIGPQRPSTSSSPSRSAVASPPPQNTTILPSSRLPSQPSAHTARAQTVAVAADSNPLIPASNTVPKRERFVQSLSFRAGESSVPTENPDAPPSNEHEQAFALDVPHREQPANDPEEEREQEEIASFLKNLPSINQAGPYLSSRRGTSSSRATFAATGRFRQRGQAAGVNRQNWRPAPGAQDAIDAWQAKRKPPNLPIREQATDTGPSAGGLPPGWSLLHTQDEKMTYISTVIPQWQILSHEHPLSLNFVDLPLRKLEAPVGSLPSPYTGIVYPDGKVRYLDQPRTLSDSRSYEQYFEAHCTDVDPRTQQQSRTLRLWEQNKNLSAFRTNDIVPTFAVSRARLPQKVPVATRSPNIVSALENQVVSPIASPSSIPTAEEPRLPSSNVTDLKGKTRATSPELAIDRSCDSVVTALSSDAGAPLPPAEDEPVSKLRLSKHPATKNPHVVESPLPQASKPRLGVHTPLAQAAKQRATPAWKNREDVCRYYDRYLEWAKACEFCCLIFPPGTERCHCGVITWPLVPELYWQLEKRLTKEIFEFYLRRWNAAVIEPISWESIKDEEPVKNWASDSEKED